MILNIPKLLMLEALKKAETVVEGENYNDIVKGVAFVDNFADIGDIKEQIVLVDKTDIAYLENCIARLREAGAYGIMTKHTHAELEKICRRYSLTLIVLPQDASELKVIQEIGSCIIDKYIRRENYIRSCYNSFYKEEYGATAYEILSALSEMLDAPVIAYYAGGKIGSTGGIEMGGDEYVIEEEKDGRQSITVGDIKMEGVIIPFKVLGRVYGRLFVKSDHEITEPEWYVIKGAMAAITMATTREYAIAEIEQKMKNELLNDLITGDIRSENSIVVRAEDLGWNITRPSIAVCCKMNMAGHKNKNDMITAHRRVKLALAHLMDEKLGRSENWVIGAAGDTVNVLWPDDTEKSYSANCDDIREVLSQLFESETDKYGISGFTGGIGSRVYDIYGIRKGFDDAVSAIKYGYMTGEGNRIFDVSGLGIYRFIGKIGSREELVSFVPHSLVKLMEYDSVSKNVLVDTLDAYLNCDCNINKASRMLDIHYKTLVYRIGRIKEIMELESIEGDVRLEIQLALKILRILGKEK